MLKLIVHHAPKLLVFVCGLHLRLSKPQWQHVIRMADALIVSDTRHKTIASLYRLIVDAPDASNGADNLRLSPWTADDLRAPIRHFIVTDLVVHATETNTRTLYVSLDDSLGAKDKDTRHLEAVEYHHDHTKTQGRKNPTLPMAPCILKCASTSGHARMLMTGGCISVKKQSDISTDTGRQNVVDTFVSKPAWHATCWQGYSHCSLRGSTCMCFSTVGMHPMVS